MNQKIRLLLSISVGFIMDDTYDYHYWNSLSEKEYLQKAYESIEKSRSYSIEEAEKILDEVIARREQMLKSAKKLPSLQKKNMLC